MAARFSILIAWIATVLIFVPFWPDFPFATLDASWKYAINEAVAERLVFGKDLIFGFGPLAPVYIRMYHPGTDIFMIGFGVLFALALAAGCSSISRSNRPYLLLGLPIVMPQILLFDAVFLCLPFLFLLMVTRWSSNETEHHKSSALTGIAFVGTAVGLLPLVKGSFTGTTLACGGLAWLLIARRSLLIGALSLLWAIAAMAIAWRLTGQPLGELPGFFLAQGPIISGYGEAMSTKGPMLQVVVYIAGAVTIVKAFAIDAKARYGKLASAPILGLILTLFVALKAGFVRHDVHALIAASTLLISAYLSLLMFQSRRIATAMVVSILVWAFIAYRHIDLSPTANLNRLTTTLLESGRGLVNRFSDSDSFHRKFAESLAGMRGAFPLPPTDESVDLYPAELFAIFANGQRWMPRPVPQSYSAYTPGLLELNRQHLAGARAPGRIYFSVSPIDGHYPSTEDGASWIELMSRYRVEFLFGKYAVLEKRSAPVAVGTGSMLMDKDDGELGSPVHIPELNSSDSPVWAKFEVEPSLVGSAYAALFKLPPLRFTIQYEDGTPAQFRFIPGTARAGFVLSPTVQTAGDFTALQRPHREEYFKGRKLVSFEISTKLWIQRLLWKRHYAVRLSTMTVTPDENIPQELNAQ